MQADLKSLLAQIAVDKISIRDLAAMCLVVGIVTLAFANPFSVTHITKNCSIVCMRRGKGVREGQRL